MNQTPLPQQELRDIVEFLEQCEKEENPDEYMNKVIAGVEEFDSISLYFNCIYLTNIITLVSLPSSSLTISQCNFDIYQCYQHNFHLLRCAYIHNSY